METKKCSKCKKVKNKEDFSKQLDKKDGLRANCKECIKSKYENNRNAELLKHKYYYKANKDKIKAKVKDYYLRNKEKVKAYRKNYRKTRESIDPLYKLTGEIRTITGRAFKLKGYKKDSKTQDILGCSFETFKLHIEKQFKVGMSWQNREKWHIDHIKPLSSAKNREDILVLSHYTNLQPLWAVENLRKSNKV